MASCSWGLQVGNYCRDNRYNIPVILSTQKGGFCLNYLKKDELSAEIFIENVVLYFIARMKEEDLKIHLWDCAIHKRFPFLAELEEEVSLSHAQSQIEITKSFQRLELLAKDRHKKLLNINTPTLASYNEKYPHLQQTHHLIIINGDDYPDAQSSITRWQYFFQAAASAGIFIIMFTTKENYQSTNTSAWAWLKSQLPSIYFKQQEWSFSPEAFEFQSLRQWYEFSPLRLDKRKLINSLVEGIPYQLSSLLGESYEEYGALVHDAISDLKQGEEERFLNEDIKNRLLAAAQHHQENIAKQEEARRERLRLKTEKLERLLELKRQERDNEARYQAMKRAQELEELAIQRREEAEKLYYDQQIRQVQYARTFLMVLVVLTSLSLVWAFATPNLNDYQHLTRVSAYIAFSTVLLFFIFYFILTFSYSDSHQQLTIKRGVLDSIYVMLAINSLIFSALVVLTLYNSIHGNMDKFILLSAVNIISFFTISLLYR